MNPVFNSTIFKSIFRFLIKRIIIISIIMSAHNSYSQQEIRFEHITVQDGLPENSVRQIIQDYQGFLWFATQNGLVKYDGYKFIVYNFNPLDSHSIGGRNIFSLYEDRSKIIWIGTEFGLSKYDREKNRFDNYFLGDNMQDRYFIFSICEDDYGFLYFGSIGTGLYKFDKAKKSYTKFKHNPDDSKSIGSDNINRVIGGDSSTIWIGTSDDGLIKFNIIEQTFKSYKSKPGDSNSIISNYAYSLYKDRSGNLWIGTNRGLNKFDEMTETFTAYKIPIEDQVIPENFEIEDIHEDKNGFLWFAVVNYGLVKFEPATGRLIKYENDPLKNFTLSSNIVSCVFEDRSGVLWVGTFWGGMNKYDQRKSKFTHFMPNINENNININVESLLKDSSGDIWVGTFNGLNRFDRNTNTFVDFNKITGKKEKLGSSRIRKLFTDSYGYFWIGTIDGLMKYDTKKKAISVFKHIPGDTTSITGNLINDIYQDRKDNLWICTSTGLNVFDRKYNTFKTYQHNNDDSNSISNDQVLCIYEDSVDDLWLGTNWGGLNKFDRVTGSFITYHYPRLGFTTLEPILEDNQGNLLIGSYQTGLNTFDRNTGEIRYITEKEGLINNTISSMIKDNSGNLWVGTDYGLTRFNPVTNSLKNFDKNDLPFTRFLKGVIKDNDGYLYFGGEGGFIMFHPDSIKDNEHVPEIVLTEFMMFNKAVQPDEDSPLKKNINVADKIELSYYDNSFSFEFAALDYKNPGRNQYAYMMEGFDKNWIGSGNIRNAYYTNLDPGEYTFRVKGSNNDGVWNEEGASVKIIITPPWWQTWWFRGCGILLIIGLLGYTRQRKLSKIREELHRQSEFTKQLINTQEAERKRIAGELHDTLGQDLLIIKNKALLGMKNPLKNPEVVADISEISSSSLQEVREISYNLHPYQLEQLGLTKAVESIIERASKSSSIKFSYELDNIDKLFNPETEINLFRMIQESINNILKHSEATEAVISVLKDSEEVSVNVKDNGKGFDVLISKSKRGLGLMSLFERAKISGAKVDIDSRPGKGTLINISISIPIN